MTFVEAVTQHAAVPQVDRGAVLEETPPRLLGSTGGIAAEIARAPLLDVDAKPGLVGAMRSVAVVRAGDPRAQGELQVVAPTVAVDGLEIGVSPPQVDLDAVGDEVVFGVHWIGRRPSALRRRRLCRGHAHLRRLGVNAGDERPPQGGFVQRPVGATQTKGDAVGALALALR